MLELAACPGIVSGNLNGVESPLRIVLSIVLDVVLVVVNDVSTSYLGGIRCRYPGFGLQQVGGGCLSLQRVPALFPAI